MVELAPLEVAIITNLVLMLAAFIVLGNSVNTVQQHSFPTQSSGCIAAPKSVKGYLFYQLLSVGLFLIAFTIPFSLKIYLIIMRGANAAAELTPRWLAGYVTLSGVFTLGGFIVSAVAAGYMIDLTMGRSYCNGYSKDSYIVMSTICVPCFTIFLGAVLYGMFRAAT